METKREWIVCSYVYKIGYIVFGYIDGSHHQNLPFYLWNIVWLVSIKIYINFMVVINYVIIAQKQLEFVSDKLKSNQFLGF